MVKSKYIAWLHILGIVLCLGALGIGGLQNPAIGFPIVITILISLEVFSPKPTNTDILRTAYGSIRRGGIRRGIFIREMFAAALTFSAISNFALGMTTPRLFQRGTGNCPHDFKQRQ
ncbi:hypothetical protein ACFLYR_02935 [Chloroflexota bacterium]